MSSLPNKYTTQPIWDLWLEVSRAFGSKVKLGGIYANKSGYHNTREANQRRWPGNYSIVLTLDKQGPSDKAAALDLTFPSAADMRKYTKRLRDAMKRGDSRMEAVKEFYGTVNSRTVYGLGKKSRHGTPYKTSADKSHLWHIHISFFRADVENDNRIAGVFSVLAGTSKPKNDTPAKPVVIPRKEKHKPAPGPDYAFPLPSGYYFGPRSGGNSSVSGFYPRKFKGVSDNTWIKRWVNQLNKRGWSAKKGGRYLRKYGNDGLYGRELEALIRAFQRDQGLREDGLLGRNTWNAAFDNPVT